MTDDAPELTLPEELLLLTLDPHSGKPLCGRACLRHGVAGAVLAELELRGRIREERGRVQVVNPLGPAHPLLAWSLDTLGGPDKSRFRPGTSAKDWVGQYGRHLEERHLDALAERGLLHRETRRFLGFLPYRRHFPAHPELTAGARRRFGEADLNGFPDARGQALGGLVSALGLAGALTATGRAGRTTMKTLRRAQWTSTAVHHHVRRSTSGGSESGGWSDGDSGGGSGCGSGCGGGD